MRVTLSDLKASRFPESLNLPPSDSRIVQFANDATRRLLPLGRWWGTLGKYAISADKGMITLPRQIASIEAVAINHSPVPVHDRIYEFLANGYGTRDDTNLQGISEAQYRGHYPINIDVSGTDKKLQWVCDLPDDVGKPVTTYGLDATGNWIRTKVGGVWQDGETVTLVQTPGTLSTNVFSKVTDIQLPSDMDGQSWLYTNSTDDGSSSLIGQYEYYETRPSFSRWLFPSLVAATSASPVLVEVLAKLEFLPVRNDSDYLLLGNTIALTFGAMAAQADEEGRWADSNTLMVKAVAQLNAELDHYLGAGRRIGMTVVGASVGEAETLPNLM
jgi:hypothetical protein